MRNFFKIFFASLFALVIFSLVILLFVVLFAKGLTSKNVQAVESRSVLMIDLGQHYKEQRQENNLSILTGNDESDVPGLYDVIRLLHKAKTDKNISGIYIIANASPNGFAASDEIRNALIDFKQSRKFIIAQGDVMTQKAYAVANVADKIYLSPQGSLQWVGFSVDYIFFKQALDRLGIQPQIFYAGKFKSATEPFRVDKMTEENRLQTTVWLGDLYNDFLLKTSKARNIDTTILHQLANEAKIQKAEDAVTYKLADGLKYDDEVKDEIKNRLSLGKFERINFVSINDYMANGKYIGQNGEKIALIYAEGNIVDGRAEVGVISTENYRNLIRNARLDKTIKAIVFRVNSGGGSSMASENIWRELALAKKEKPVVVSFGDVAASGGYYISCAADSIFALPTTITGSIGVFGIIPNMEEFFKNKLGITFDGVKTGPYAGTPSPVHSMTDNEKKIIQNEIEAIYSTFKQRVAEGRRKDTAYIGSIAQGRVWTGMRAKEIGLIDHFGGIEDAIACAARLTKLTEYKVKEYPEPQNLFDRFMKKTNPFGLDETLKKEIGEDNYQLYMEMKKVKEMTNSIQSRLPFDFIIR